MDCRLPFTLLLARGLLDQALGTLPGREMSQNDRQSPYGIVPNPPPPEVRSYEYTGSGTERLSLNVPYVRLRISENLRRSCSDGRGEGGLPLSMLGCT